MADNKTFKVVLLGGTGVGKTTHVARMLAGEFIKDHVPTLGVNVHPFTFYTDKGHVCFNVWDCAGDERFGGLRNQYLNGAQGALVFYDVKAPSTWDSVAGYISQIKEMCGDIPIVICANKFEKGDMSNKNTKDQWYTSSCTNFNIEKPWLELIQKLLNDPTIKFVPAPAVTPPEVEDVDVQVAIEDATYSITNLVEVLKSEQNKDLVAKIKDQLAQLLSTIEVA
jgi:GTP-binding nuclear protein Ran